MKCLAFLTLFCLLALAPVAPACGYGFAAASCPVAVVQPVFAAAIVQPVIATVAVQAYAAPVYSQAVAFNYAAPVQPVVVQRQVVQKVVQPVVVQRQAVQKIQVQQVNRPAVVVEQRSGLFGLQRSRVIVR